MASETLPEEATQTKHCFRCKSEKPMSEFYRNKGKKDGLEGQCKECHLAYDRARANTEGYRALRRAQYRKHRNAHLVWHRRRTYGISEQGYLEIFRKQNGKCAICGVSHLELTRALCVDHDHETGEIRGLLCTRCNSMLGYCLDSTKILEQGIQYLQKHKKRCINGVPN